MIAAPTLHFDGSAAIAGVSVFQNAKFIAKSGQWTCLLGASGVGKSTILKLFAGLDANICLSGSFGADDGALCGRVALMAQDDLLLPWLTALENVLLGARLRGDRPNKADAHAVLAQVGLIDMAARKSTELSGGQRQRVALARTLMEDRPIVLLDEPFSALDARTRAQMQELTAQLLCGRTVLLVTHDPGEAARLGQAILVMTPSGIQTVTAPAQAVPRPASAPEVLRLQADLLTILRREDP